MEEHDKYELTPEEQLREKSEQRRMFIEKEIEGIKEEARTEAEQSEKRRRTRKYYASLIYYILLAVIIFGLVVYFVANRNNIWL